MNDLFVYLCIIGIVLTFLATLCLSTSFGNTILKIFLWLLSTWTYLLIVKHCPQSILNFFW